MPPELNVENLRKQAKSLLKAVAAGDGDSVARACTGLPRLSDTAPADVPAAGLTLQEMQHVIAVEQGFRDWKQLLSASGEPRRRKRRNPLHVRPSLQQAQAEAEWLLWMVDRGEGWTRGRVTATGATLTEVQQVVAEDYGYDDWAALEAGLTHLHPVHSFEDLAHLEDDEIRQVILRMGRDKLALVLKTASEPLQARFRTSMDDGEWQALQQAIEALGPVPLSAVQAAQARALQVYRTEDPMV